MNSKSKIGWALIILGVVAASIAIIITVREKGILRELESSTEELRANGAIIENYYILRVNDEQHSRIKIASAVSVLSLILGIALCIRYRRSTAPS